MTFLDCPAYLDQGGTARCGLPAEVRCRFVMRSTDGPIECAMIRCPAGHWFNGAVESRSRAPMRNPGRGTVASASRSARATTQTGSDRDGSGGLPAQEFAAEPGPRTRRPNTAPAYYLGRPAELWINAFRPSRKRSMQPRPGLVRPYRPARAAEQEMPAALPLA
jgi:hypothetical protein